MTGLNALDTIGRTVKELMPGTEQHWIDIYGRVALTGEPIFFENYSSELHKHFEVTAFRPAPKQFACIFVDITERKHVEQEKRQFYRDTIKSVTQGKLDLVSFEDIEVYVDPSGFLASIDSPVDIAIARSKTMEFCKSRGLDDNGIGLFESAVGEAMTNATKHADGCKVYAGVNGNNIWVAVSDTGKGISTMLLPGATLRKGYSSKISMGMGYTIMMEATDNIMLCTGTEGTTVVLSVNVSSSMPALSLDDFPDTWDEISNS
jgi:anti-sigma regulatory factor (Ser/Thr protein kinase)